jgi:hypothetical protein
LVCCTTRRAIANGLQFHSFNDDATHFDHGTIGAEEIKKTGLLNALFSIHDQELIDFAIRHHNKMAVPEESPGKLLFAKIIRDADKLDIFRCLPPIQAEHDYSPTLLALLNRRAALPYAEVKTPGDKRLIRLGWLYGINFDWTLLHLVQEGYVEQLLTSLPDTIPLNTATHNFRDYIAQRLCSKHNL